MVRPESESDRRQPVRTLDHVVVIVEDLDDAAARLESIGFYVTERSDHPFGTSNRLVMLTGSYIELIALTTPDQVEESVFARFVSDSLAAGRTGPRLVVFRSDAPESDRAGLEAAGVPDLELHRFGRDALLPDGTSARVEFITLVPDFGNASVAAFLCHHLTPETVWHPVFLEHPNGGGKLATAVLPDPGPGGWDRIAAMASAAGGPPVVAANTRLDQGEPRLVIAGTSAATTTIGDTTIEVVPVTR